MDVSAKLRYLRMSPKKVRLVIDIIRGMDLEEAQNQLKFINKKASRPVLKLLNSAMANAENNFKLDRKNLYIKKITADEGPRLKRWKPRAFGRATPILKRSSHLTVILGEKRPTQAAKKKLKEKEEVPVITEPEEIAETVGEAKKKELEEKKKMTKPRGRFQKFRERFLRKSGM